jgi:hypothetical protein
MKATAVLRAVGYVPILEISPSRPAQIHRWRRDAVHDHQQATWHAGWAVVAGRSRAIGRPENTRPFVSRRSPG